MSGPRKRRISGQLPDIFPPPKNGRPPVDTWGQKRPRRSQPRENPRGHPSSPLAPRAGYSVRPYVTVTQSRLTGYGRPSQYRRDQAPTSEPRSPQSGVGIRQPAALPCQSKGPAFMTRAKFVGLLGVLALVLPSAVPARADQETRASKAYVVVVGIDNYGDKQIKPRKHAEADAKALYELLTDKKYLGVSPENARLLLGSGTGKDKATHANTLDAVKWLVSKAGRDDLAVFAWFGSGAPNGEQTCYCTTDSTFKGRARDSLAAAEIEHEMEKLKSQRFVAFLDVNFKGFDAGGERAPEANIARFYQEFFGKAKAKEDEEDRRREGRILFLANDGMHPSLDLDKHGIFAQAILNGLKGGADKEGYGPDGNVTVEELEEYLAKELPALARQNGKTPEEKRQLPIILGSRASHFVLVHNPEVMPKVQARLDKLAQLARDKKLSPELAREGENLLSRMPKLKAYQKLRKEYEKLADGEATVENLRTAREGILESIKLRRSAA